MDDVGAAIWVSQEWRIKIAIKISEKSSAYEWVLMCDADVVCLRNWDHLFEDVEGDLLVSRNSEKEIDAGFFAVRGSLFAEFAAEWARSFKSTRDIPNTRRDGRALNSLLENTSWQVKDFEKGEIVRLYDKNTSPSQVLSSAGVHIGGGTIDEKCQLAFGLHMMRTYGERDGIFLDLLES